MGRRMKDGRYVNVNIDREAFEALERHCAESGQTKTVAVERAVLACYGKSRKRRSLLDISRGGVSHNGEN